MSSLDVIVPCYRYGRYLRQCVESVLAHTELEVRVLILDDASPDNTAEVGTALARADERVTFIKHATNKGHIATYNEGIEWVAATYLLLLSADDYLLPESLTRAVGLMDQYPDVGFVFGNALELNESGATTPTRPLDGWSNLSSRCVLTGSDFVTRSGATNIVPTPTAVVRTSLQKTLGGYRADLPHTGDMEMWLRLSSSAAVGFVDAYQAVYRTHRANMSTTYKEAHCLPDIVQRRAALESFFSDTGRQWAESTLERQVWRSLALEAVEHASAAFNDGATDVSQQLSDLAAAMCPDIRGSWRWNKVKCKRLLGRRAWRVVEAVRQ